MMDDENILRLLTYKYSDDLLEALNEVSHMIPVSPLLGIIEDNISVLNKLKSCGLYEMALDSTSKNRPNISMITYQRWLDTYPNVVPSNGTDLDEYEINCKFGVSNGQ